MLVLVDLIKCVVLLFFGIGISISILDYGQAESITNTGRSIQSNVFIMNFSTELNGTVLDFGRPKSKGPRPDKIIHFKKSTIFDPRGKITWVLDREIIYVFNEYGENNFSKTNKFILSRFEIITNWNVLLLSAYRFISTIYYGSYCMGEGCLITLQLCHRIATCYTAEWNLPIVLRHSYKFKV